MFKKILVLPVMLVLLAAGCNATTTTTKTDTSSNNTAAEAIPQAPNSVTIKDYKFAPQSMTVKKGTTITWTNQDDAKHNVVAVGDNAANGPKSELLAKGQSYTYTFNTVGTYSYKCEPHPYMTASVIVTE